MATQRRPRKELMRLPQSLRTTDETAEFLRVSKRTLQRRIKEGLISPIVMGPRKHMFTEEEITRFLNDQTRIVGTHAATSADAH